MAIPRSLNCLLPCRRTFTLLEIQGSADVLPAVVSCPRCHKSVLQVFEDRVFVFDDVLVALGIQWRHLPLRCTASGWDAVCLDHDLGGEIFVDTALPNTGSEVARGILRDRPQVDLFLVHFYNTPAREAMVRDLSLAGYRAAEMPFGLLVACLQGIKEKEKPAVRCRSRRQDASIFVRRSCAIRLAGLAGGRRRARSSCRHLA